MAHETKSHVNGHRFASVRVATDGALSVVPPRRGRFATVGLPGISRSPDTAPRPPDTERPPCVPLYRSILAVDIENSTARANPVKAELRSELYQMFAAALEEAGVHGGCRDALIDRGDGILALIHPVDQAPKIHLLGRAVPGLARLLATHNASVPVRRDPRLALRLRVVLHAGEVHYDANGCFGEALDVAFRLLDAKAVKMALSDAAASLVLVISDDIFRSLVSHGYDDIDKDSFVAQVRVQVAGHRHQGWLSSGVGCSGTGHG